MPTRSRSKSESLRRRKIKDKSQDSADLSNSRSLSDSRPRKLSSSKASKKVKDMESSASPHVGKDSPGIDDLDSASPFKKFKVRERSYSAPNLLDRRRKTDKAEQESSSQDSPYAPLDSLESDLQGLDLADEKIANLTVSERERMTFEMAQKKRAIENLGQKMKEIDPLSDEWARLRTEQMGLEREFNRLEKRLREDDPGRQQELMSGVDEGYQLLTRMKERESYWSKVNAGLESDYGTKLSKFVSEMVSEVDRGNWVLLNEKHGNAAGFAVTRMIMESSEKPGTLFLEAPYGFNGKKDMHKGLQEWSASYGQPAMSDVVDMAVKKGWKVVPVDALSEHGSGNDKEALRQSDLPGSDSERQLGLQVGGVLRQNYIAKNMHEDINKQKQLNKGGILIIGGAHIRGDKKSGMPALSDMMSSVKYKKEGRLDLGTDTFAQVIGKDKIKDDVTYGDPSKRDMNESDGRSLKSMLKKDRTLEYIAGRFQIDEATAKQWISKVSPNHKLVQ